MAIADPPAAALGVRAGMKRGGVLTLSPDIALHERDPAREKDLQHAVACALMRFSPMVAVCEEQTIVVDVTGSLRLFGGIVRLCHQMREITTAVGLTARVSTAPTGQAAWLLAKRGRQRVLKLRSLERVLGGLAFLTVPEVREFAEWFAGLGCKTLGDIRRLPRAGLKRRCGVHLLDSLDVPTGWRRNCTPGSSCRPPSALALNCPIASNMPTRFYSARAGSSCNCAAGWRPGSLR